jgi:uncharacterized membrane protein
MLTPKTFCLTKVNLNFTLVPVMLPVPTISQKHLCGFSWANMDKEHAKKQIIKIFFIRINISYARKYKEKSLLCSRLLNKINFLAE